MALHLTSRHEGSTFDYLSSTQTATALADATLEVYPLSTRTVMHLDMDGRLEQSQYMRMWPLSSWLLSSHQGSYYVLPHSEEQDPAKYDPATDEAPLTTLLCYDKGVAVHEQLLEWLLVASLKDPASSGAPSIGVALSHEISESTHTYKLWKKKAE